MFAPSVVDLYHGDTVTSFSKLKAAGVIAVIHKATEGDSYVDPTYAQRRTQALAANLLWGAYHFMKTGDPVAQAGAFLNAALPGGPDGETLLALDHEKDASGASATLAQAIAFMQEVENAVGRQCVLYSGDLLKEQIGKATAVQRAYLKSRRLWLPEYGPEPKPPSGFKVWLWQFTGDGVGPSPHTLSGVSGNIDINSYSGTPDQLASEWAGSPLSSPASPSVAAVSPQSVTVPAALPAAAVSGNTPATSSPTPQEQAMSFLDSITSDLQALQKILPIVSPRLAQVDHVLLGAVEHLGKFIDAGESPQSAASAVTSLTDAAVNAAQTVQAATGASTQSAVSQVTDHLDPSQPNSDALTPDDDDSDTPDAPAPAAGATPATPAGTSATPAATMSLTTPVSPAPAS